MMKRFVFLILLAVLSTNPARAIDNAGLASVHADVLETYGSVQHISAQTLASLDSANVLLLDVREPAEYAVSRIAGALVVPPDISRENFVAQFAAKARGKRVVVYCSVGHRSSKLAQSVQDDLRKAGASSVHNLTGGLFNWHNEARPVANDRGSTDFIHPYSWWWGRHLDRGKLRRYK